MAIAAFEEASGHPFEWEDPRCLEVRPCCSERDSGRLGSFYLIKWEVGNFE
jgi:hypothetical protein